MRREESEEQLNVDGRRGRRKWKNGIECYMRRNAGVWEIGSSGG